MNFNVPKDKLNYFCWMAERFVGVVTTLIHSGRVEHNNFSYQLDLYSSCSEDSVRYSRSEGVTEIVLVRGQCISPLSVVRMKHQEIIIFSSLSPRLRLISRFSPTPITKPYLTLRITTINHGRPPSIRHYPECLATTIWRKPSFRYYLSASSMVFRSQQATTSLATVLHHVGITSGYVGITYPVLVRPSPGRAYQPHAVPCPAARILPPVSCRPRVSRRNQRARRSSSYHKDARVLNSTTQLSLISQI